MMGSPLTFATLFLFFISIFSVIFGKEIHLNFILGSTEKLSCHSSYPPPWTKSANGDMSIIGVNGGKHSNWNEPRHKFLNNGSYYSIQISDVHLNDAGKYTCGSDTAISFIITVLR